MDCHLHGRVLHDSSPAESEFVVDLYGFINVCDDEVGELLFRVGGGRNAEGVNAQRVSLEADLLEDDTCVFDEEDGMIGEHEEVFGDIAVIALDEVTSKNLSARVSEVEGPLHHGGLHGRQTLAFALICSIIVERIEENLIADTFETTCEVGNDESIYAGDVCDGSRQQCVGQLASESDGRVLEDLELAVHRLDHDHITATGSTKGT